MKDSKVQRNERFGYRAVSPMPSAEEVADFYGEGYYERLSDRGTAPHLQRLRRGGEEAEAEREWLRSTLYEDIADALARFSPGKRVVDIGCGTGELLLELKERGYQCSGLEPSTEARGIALTRGIEVLDQMSKSFADERPGSFDAVVTLNVLEHLRDPIAMMSDVANILVTGGIFIVQVPNDFTEAQELSQQATGRQPWWITVPDHLHYFNFDSLGSALESEGFEIVERQADFPMELFLMMGMDYVGTPSLGKECHQRRVALERAMPGKLRRALYQKFAELNMGRNCRLVARRL